MIETLPDGECFFVYRSGWSGIIWPEVYFVMKMEPPYMPLEYVPTPGDREKRCRGFKSGRGDAERRRNGDESEG